MCRNWIVRATYSAIISQVSITFRRHCNVVQDVHNSRLLCFVKDGGSVDLLRCCLSFSFPLDHSGILPDHTCAALDFLLGADHSDYSNSRAVSAAKRHRTPLFVVVWGFGFTSCAGFQILPGSSRMNVLQSFSIALGRLDIISRVVNYVRSYIERRHNGLQLQSVEWEEIRGKVESQVCCIPP